MASTTSRWFDWKTWCVLGEQKPERFEPGRHAGREHEPDELLGGG